jgi:corrinoid protein of di/trimethylamine methyltransferase
MDKELLESIRNCIIEGDEDLAKQLAMQVASSPADALEAVDNGFIWGIKEVGRLYESGEYFLPEMICAADAMKAALAILRPVLDESSSATNKGTIVIATVQGDIHDIGKTIVASMLTASGYNVVDLGCDVPNELVIEKAVSENADIIALSALLPTTMEEQRNVINILKKRGIDKKVMIGGAPVSQNFADSIGASGYSENAASAVKLADRLLNQS